MQPSTPSPRPAWSGAAFAIGSAALFGISTPLAKLLLGAGASPEMLAGLFYLGSGVGLSLLQLARRGRRPAAAAEAPLRRADLPWFAAAVLLGGIVAPVLLMLGLARTAASGASLLLNLEGIATMVIAWVIFRENVDRRILAGALAIIAGASLLAWRGGGIVPGEGALLIVAACVAWGADNNLTRKFSGADPVQITLIKGLVAGGVNLALALATGSRLPPPATTLAAAAVGFVAYGLSLVLYVRGLRDLGAARTSAYFSTAPFIGALLAIVLLAEPVTVQLVAAGILMACGVYLHLRESHEHEHTHEPMAHEHRHVHDEHHQHEHPPGMVVTEPHSHWHRHERLTHRHRHYPDLHHQHGHDAQ